MQLRILIFQYFLADCNHLNCFVEVTKCIVKNHAEATLLSNLYEIGVKLAALIYDTPENTGYVEFHSKCKLVLSTLKQYSYLTNIMVRSVIISPLMFVSFQYLIV